MRMCDKKHAYDTPPPRIPQARSGDAPQFETCSREGQLIVCSRLALELTILNFSLCRLPLTAARRPRRRHRPPYAVDPTPGTGHRGR